VRRFGVFILLVAALAVAQAQDSTLTLTVATTAPAATATSTPSVPALPGLPVDTLLEQLQIPVVETWSPDSAWLAWCAEDHCLSTDSLLWYAGTSSKDIGRNLDTLAVFRALASLDRASPMALEPNREVLDRVAFFLKYRPVFLGRMLGRTPHYFPLFEQTLDRHNLPLELKFLPILESGLNPVARSRAGATGLWQFMFNTGRGMDLLINSWVDERRDPERATDAACRYLGKLNRMYDGDWLLALAAYNAGPGNVNKAMRRSGGKTFWEIRHLLPRETQKYIPSFIALNYVMEHPQDCGLVPSNPWPSWPMMDTVMVMRDLRFDQIAEALGVSEEIVERYNPMYRKQIVPGSVEGGWPVQLPAESIPLFLANYPEMLEIESYKTPEVSFEPAMVVYRVKSGDVLGTIAGRHGVSVRNLRSWNGLRSDVIQVGQRLYIHADPR
jgi:membrane-bound lytic murein transglycosylase D